MPIESELLKDRPSPRKSCPFCGDEPFRPWARGTIQRAKRRWWMWKDRAYCALVCTHCGEIVGWEKP